MSMPLVTPPMGPTEVAAAPYRWPEFTSLDSLRQTADQLFHRGTAEELFGVASEQAMLPSLDSTPFDPIATAGFGILALVLFFLYLSLLYRHSDNLIRLFGRLTIDRATDERLQEGTSSNYTRFLTYGSLVAYGLIGLGVVRVASHALPASMLGSVGSMSALWWSLALSGTLLVVTLVRLALLSLIGELTYTQELVGGLWLAKRSALTLAMIIATPPVALWLLMPKGEGDFWLWVIIIELVISLFLYLREILMLFLSKKVSILHCFLYLCAVEIFPISLLWLIFFR